ncbi:MAG: GNAT family N-acetyltransferase [Acidobacteria bacterium]|nr:GNAT family N-acetyltransferase [Acidobacteriota bacterium]
MRGTPSSDDAASVEGEPAPDSGASDRAPAGSSRDVAYPAELERELAGIVERHLRLRPVRSDDAERLVAFHSRLSPGSIYRRYFAVRPLLTAQEVSHLTQVDYVDRLALVVVDAGAGDAIVAIGRYERIPATTTGEVAFVVRDDFQHLGLGHLLLDQLAQAAWARGLTKFSAVTLRENRGMIAIFEHSGFPVTTSQRDEEYYVSFSIDPAERRHASPALDPSSAE